MLRILIDPARFDEELCIFTEYECSSPAYIDCVSISWLSGDI
jgi:hypothetical protein